jgi:hypothetical protein
MESFYLTVAGFCFTLLGLWWAVVQLKITGWAQDHRMRQLASGAHLAFLLPGVMSLAAALSADLKLIWQVVFIVAGVFGLFVSIGLVFIADRPSQRLFVICSALAYTAIALGGIITMLNPALFAPFTPLQVEGLLVTLVIMCGVSVAWELLWRRD